MKYVHGGPWARGYWGFNSDAQWFANRGYACLQGNYRGSSSYGKSILHKGDKEWGVGAMQHDLTDAVARAVEQGIADPDNVCIYGGSYGGYACLAGLIFTPDLYKCGVDIVGPSNIKTLMDSIPAYWGPFRNDMLKQIGNVDEDKAFNEMISPLFHVDQIKAPLLIGQGANDPRVKQAEADQIAFSMADKGIPVEYVLYPDEGHGWARPENRLDFNGRTELFLAKHLGGRAEPFEPPAGSTPKFPLCSSRISTARVCIRYKSHKNQLGTTRAAPSPEPVAHAAPTAAGTPPASAAAAQSRRSRRRMTRSPPPRRCPGR